VVKREILGIWGVVVCFGCGSSERARDSGGESGRGGEGAFGAAGASGAFASAGATAGGGAGSGGEGAGTSGASGNATGGNAGTMAGGASGAAGGANASCPGSTNHTPGTRIRGRFIVTAEGDRAWNGWHDTELDQECSFNGLPDGTMRCIPRNWQTSITVYTDAACTAPVYTAGESSACTPMSYVMLYRQGDCTTPTGYEFYELGEEVTPAAVYAVGEDGVCTLTTAPDVPLYLPGPPVPSERFVAAEAFTAEGSTRVRAVGYLAADGTRQVTGWRDTGLDGESCFIRRTDDGALRCVPTGASLGAYYADAACTERLASFPSFCGAAPPRYATMSANPYCSADGDVVAERGEVFSGVVFNRAGEGACEPAVVQPAEPMSRAIPMPASTFAEIGAHTDESDGTRLKPHYYDAADGGCWFWKFWDSELDVSCGFDVAEDGVYRCLPGDMASFADVFTDDACTTPARVLSLDTCENPVVPEYVLDVVPSECDFEWRVYRTSPVSGALYRMELGACVTVEDTSTLALVTAVDPAMFMAGELRVE
jgi:hypothetical protein